MQLTEKPFLRTAIELNMIFVKTKVEISFQQQNNFFSNVKMK
jgi:hypothetical protein